MGILENFEPPKKNYACKIRSILIDLELEDKKVLVAALKDTDRWPAKTLSNALKQRGVSLVDASITRHRQGLCSCLKD